MTRRRPPAVWWRIVVFAAVVAGFVAYAFHHARAVRAAVDGANLSSVVASLPITSSELERWAASRQAQAVLLARVFEHDRAEAYDPSRAFARYAAILRGLDASDGYAGGWMAVDGRIVVGVGDTSGAGSVGSPPKLGAVTVVHGGRVALDFVGGATSAYVVLRTIPSDASFPGLNPAPPDNHSGRTTIVARVGDSLYVVATKTNGDRRLPARAYKASSAPPTFALASDGTPRSGFETGVAGARVAYGTTPLAIPGWTLVREQDTEEVYGPVRPRLVLALAQTGLVVVLLVLLGEYLLRTIRSRQQHELTRIRADFVSSVSHELRTPLSQIRMYAELLRKGSMRTPEDRERALEVIEKEAHRLNILVDNVLNFTRLRRQAAAPPTVPTRVDDDVRHVVAAFAPLARERSVAIEVRTQPGLVAAVDSLALRQILFNFLENAVKYGPAGQTVVVGAEAAGVQSRIWVEDAGPGVPGEERDTVWQPFVRGAAARATNATGSGIGLSVVRDLVLQHGGTCSVDAGTRGGARFTVEFPQRAT